MEERNYSEGVVVFDFNQYHRASTSAAPSVHPAITSVAQCTPRYNRLTPTAAIIIIVLTHKVTFWLLLLSDWLKIRLIAEKIVMVIKAWALGKLCEYTSTSLEISCGRFLEKKYFSEKLKAQLPIALNKINQASRLFSPNTFISIKTNEILNSHTMLPNAVTSLAVSDNQCGPIAILKSSALRIISKSASSNCAVLPDITRMLSTINSPIRPAIQIKYFFPLDF